MFPVFAQEIQPIPTTAVPYPELGALMTTALQVALLAAGLLVFGLLIFGGIRYMTSGGDKVATQGAKDMITSAIVGLLIIVAAFGIAVILEKVFGIRIISGITFPGAPQQIGK